MRFRPRSALLVLFLIGVLVLPPHGAYHVSAQTGLAYVPITILNNEPVSTLAPFQQSITINPSIYSSYENAQLGNIRFYYDYSGSDFSNALNGWLESFSGSPSANLATSATIWLNLPNGIAADSSVTIYMVFEALTAQFDGVSWGESPSLSSVYGQYDNGGNVFSVYDNGESLFSLSQTGTGGTSPALTTTAPSPYSNAITASVSGGSGTASTWSTSGETATALPSSYIAQTMVYLSGSTPLTDLLTNVETISQGQFYAFRFDGRSGSFDLIGNYASGGSSTSILAQSTTTSATGVWYQMTAVECSDSLSLYKSSSESLGNFGTLEAGPVQGKGYTGGGIALTTDGATSTEFWSMISVRAYPPLGVMPSSNAGYLAKVAPSAPYSNVYQISGSSPEPPSTLFETTSSPSYLPIVIHNSQSSVTKSGLQIPIQIDFNNYKTYLSSDAGNIRFFNSTTFSLASELPAWLETYSGNTTSSVATATKAEVWVALKGMVIGASSSTTIYMVFESAMDFDGTFWGEAPNLSPAYGEFDNGQNVFAYYNVSPSGTSGWTMSGTAGLTSSAPSGSYFGSSRAFYANSANGDYMDTQVGNLATNEIVTFWVYTTGLGNVFFLDNSAGKGQMARLDSRGGGDYAGLATTASWNSWSAPGSGLDEGANRWFKYDVVINSTGARAYIGTASNNITTLGAAANSLSVSNDGDYFGLVGDGLGASYVTYWNGFIIRYSPPNGIAPTISIGSVVTSAISETVMPELNEGFVGVSSGLEFYENSSILGCSTPSVDTSLSSPGGTSSSSTINPGSSMCLWSQEFSSSSVIIAGNWTLNLWASSSLLPSSLSVSIYLTNSTGSLISTIVSGASTGFIQTSKSELITKLSGSGAVQSAQSYIEVELSSAIGNSPLTVYWGSGQLTSFESPELFSDALLINNTSTSPLYINLGLASSSNSTRLGNLTAWFSQGRTAQIEIGSSIVSSLEQGPEVLVPAHSSTHLCLNVAATSSGSSTVILSLKAQSFQGAPYSQYSIILELD